SVLVVCFTSWTAATTESCASKNESKADGSLVWLPLGRAGDRVLPDHGCQAGTSHRGLTGCVSRMGRGRSRPRILLVGRRFTGTSRPRPCLLTFSNAPCLG